MRAYELIGAIDEERQIHAKLPADAPLTQDDVRLLVLLPESEDETEASWMQGIAREWTAELADEREDIYMLRDGEPIRSSKGTHGAD